mmetsp:Transcript_173/g.142  ORF Transcript_173/g.142 Transcript_173/m.142 type:complete len:89 (+) Transcript_173:54-320(+)
MSVPNTLFTIIFTLTLSYTLSSSSQLTISSAEYNGYTYIPMTASSNIHTIQIYSDNSLSYNIIPSTYSLFNVFDDDCDSLYHWDCLSC